MYDLIIIGAGIVGSATAREISRYRLKALVLESHDDVACGTTKANSAIVHSGHSTKPGSLMAAYNVRGNQMFPELCQELDVPFKLNTHLTIALTDEDLPNLETVFRNGKANGVPGLQMLTPQQALEREPNLNPDLKAALLAPSGAIVCPYECAIAMAENANVNGVEFQFNTKVTNIQRQTDGTYIVTDQNGKTYHTRTVLNAAGTHSDRIHNLVSEHKLHIIPRLGEYWMIDKIYANAFKATIFQVPGKMGKGILVSPTVDGTIIVGPTATDIDDPDNTDTTYEGLQKVLQVARRSWPGLPNAFITTFAGVRAHTEQHDFILGDVPDAPGFFDAAGIESPGLTSAPAIARDLAAMIADRLAAQTNDAYRPGRPPVLKFREMTEQQRRDAIARNPQFAKIVCRCETVTEAEIRDAIRRPLGARSIDAIKRRTRAGMGRCQAGFCLPRTMEILAEELNLPMEQITKFGGHSTILTGKLFQD